MDTKPSHRTEQAVELSSAAPLKICTKCKRELAITEFHRDRDCRFGRHPSCKACVRVYCVGKSPAKKAELAALKGQFRLAHPKRVRLQELVK